MSYFGGKSRSKATWLIGACAIALTGAAQLRATDPAWYNTSWSNRKPITISHLQVSGTSNLTNFPMLFSVTDANLKTVASGGSVGQANGNDILFTASDGVTKLNHEIETYNGATGQLIAWVQISTLSPTADTVIYAYFGNASAANQQNGTGVWDSNYKAVWHLPNGSTLSATDSTSNANNGTPTNSPAATSGEIDGAASFNGSSSYVAVPDSASLALSGSLTVSAWVKAANTTSKQHILSRWNGPYNYELYTNGDCAGGTAFGMSVSVVGSPRSDACANGTVDTNWHKLDGVYDGAHVSIYVDGALRTSTAVSGALQSAAGSNVGIGAWYGTPAFFFNGLVDEARISNTNRSADWIKTEYNNQGSAATFYSVGGLQGQGGGGSGPAWYNTSWSNRKPITVDPTKVLGGSNLANFPMLFSVTDVNLKTVANGGSVGQANGNDILFTASDGTTKLNHEIESYNGATGQLIAWVQIPTVSASANTVLYVYYGNASAANQQNGTAVWDSSYRAVWHLGNGASIALSDSSSNGNALTNTGMTAVSGQINGGANSIGSSTYGFSGTPSSAYNLSDWTYSTWAKVAAIPNPQGQNNVLFAVGAKELDIDTGGHLTAVVATSMSYRARTSSGTVSTGAWHHVAATFSSADNLWHLYLDGAEMSYSSSGTGSGTNNSDTVFAIGTSGYNNYYGNYNGSLDEMRIAAVQRSAGWIGTEYNNQSSPGTFYSVGAQQSPGGGGGSGSAWYNTSWSNRKLLTVDHTKVVGGSNLTNFPVLVSVADANLKTVANGGGVGQANGNDILFTDANGVKLNHEIETYNGATGQLVAWVQIPSVSPATDASAYIYYGNASAANQQNPSGVWDSNYKLVYHMADSGANATVADSTANASTGTAAANTNTKSTAGEVSGALSFDGNSDKVTASSFLGPAHNVTLEAWVKPTSVTGTQRVIFQGGSSSDDYLRLEVVPTNHFRTYFGNGSWGSTTGIDSTAPVTTSWTHLVALHDHTSNSTQLYVNGNLDINASDTVDPGPSPGIIVGAYMFSGYNFPGTIDEVRVSSVARSGGWIGTEYNNQSAPGTFVREGALETYIPTAVAITVTTAPAGLSATVDGSPCTTPCSLTWTPGTGHTIAAGSPQAGAAGVQYVFGNWSDGGAQTHAVSPSAAATYTATFASQYYLTTAVSGAGTIAPSSGWYASGALVTVTAAAAAGNQFSGFSGALSGTTASQNLTMNGPMAVTANFQQSVAPVGVSVTPSGQSGSVQVFTFVSTDGNGGADIVQHQLLFQSSDVASGGYSYACDFLIQGTSIYLLGDQEVVNGNTNWGPSVAFGANETRSNSQCTLDASRSSAAVSGPSVTVQLALAFTAAFAGTHVIKTELWDAEGLYWPPTQVGTWTVPTVLQPDFSVTVSPTSQPGVGGGTVPYTVSTAFLNGFNSTVSFSVSGLPAGVSGGFSPPSITAPGSTTLTLSISAGAVGGTFTITGTGGGLTRSVNASVSVTPPITILTNPTLPTGTVGQPYSQNLAATGGQPPYTWLIASDSGPLPPGLILNTNGTLSTNGGTLGGRGQNYYFKLRVNDSSGDASRIVYPYFAMMVSVAAVPLTITTSSPLPGGTVGTAYAIAFGGTGGSGVYTWSVTGTLPPGLTFSGAVLSGTPTTPGSYSFSVQLADGAGHSASLNYSLTISAGATALAITTTSPLPGGTTGAAYAQAFTATGGTTPYTWLVTSGTLPTGMTVTNGVLSGIPTIALSYSFTIQVNDSASHSASKPFSLTITSQLTRVIIATQSPLATGTAGVAYALPFTAAGGRQPYAWSATGTFPPGLTLSNGTLGGTPSTAGNYTLSVTVTDAANQTSSRNLDITIQAASPMPVSASPSSQNAAPTASASYSVVVASSAGFSGNVSLGASGMPTGATAGFSPSTLNSSGVSTLTITLGLAPPLGTFPITVTAQGGALNYSALIFLTVIPGSAANMITPANGSTLLATAAAFAWDSGAGVSQYQLSLGSTLGGSDYYSANLGSSQSVSVDLPHVSQPQTLYATLGSLIGGVWQSRSYTYTMGIVATNSSAPPDTMQAPPPLPSPSDYYIYNDGNEKTLPYQIVNGEAGLVDPDSIVMSGFGVSARISRIPSVSAPTDYSTFDMTFSAGSSTPPGPRNICVTYAFTPNTFGGSGNFSYPDPQDIQLCLLHGLDVYDATPVVTSVERFDAPGSHTFVQGEGQVGVRILGRNFGLNRSKDLSRLAVSRAGVTPQLITSWPDDGTEIDVVFNIDNTALDAYTVTVTSMGALGTNFLSGGGATPSQSTGSGQIVVGPRPIIKVSSVSWSYVTGGTQYQMYKNNSDWTTDKLADEGTTPVSNPVWADTNGNGVPTTSDPVAYSQGTTPTLANITFTANQPITKPVIVRVITDSGLAFPQFTIQFSGTSAAYTGPLASQDALPTTVANINATLTWSASFDGGTTWVPFPTTSKQRIFVTADRPTGFKGVEIPIGSNNFTQTAQAITAVRLNKVTTDFSGLITATDIANKARTNVVALFGFVFLNNLDQSGVANPWAVLDTPGQGWDCISLNEITIVQILQVGVQAGIQFAFATTDADATFLQTSTIEGQPVNLDFFPNGGSNANLFEAFLTVNTGGVPTEAHMVAPPKGPLSVATDPIANHPYVSGLSNLQRLAFAVIYNELKIDASEQWWYNPSTKTKVQGPIPFPIQIQ